MFSPSQREEVAKILGSYKCPVCGTREFSTLEIDAQAHRRCWQCGACLFEAHISGDGLVLGKFLLRVGK